MSDQVSRRRKRRGQLESLEERLAMSADGLMEAVSFHSQPTEDEFGLGFHSAPAPELHGGDAFSPGFHIEDDDPMSFDPIEQIEGLVDEIDFHLNEAHNQTGLNDVRDNYGFRGAGQTIAVIDSGVAWSHAALGGGFGEGYRVVGGYDFGENDADPDDNRHYHGTHVAGIIGSDDANHEGVAPGVDLVALKVADANGGFGWSQIEAALQWVINNRTAFDSPITAVNMSLGTSQNIESAPGWSTIEDEFAQLEAAGVFIAVSAGNDFTSYNTPGLAYPAASQYVIPVMSTDDSGQLSYFSQRHQRAIAAPGRSITSTFPDQYGNNNGITDDWATISGTSMAAPYVAGASALIREAMEFNGQTGITQDTIYDHMMATADSFYDSATGAYYSRLNLGNAIDALMPEDDYGSSVVDAYDLGTISSISAQSGLVSGVISTLTDGDYFTFTAGATGKVTFSAGNTTHDLVASWEGFGAAGWVEAGVGYSMNVEAGQEYTVAISSSDGLGYYNLSVAVEEAFSYTDWGTVQGQTTWAGVVTDSTSWYRVNAGQAGLLTADATSGSASLAWYDSNQNLIASGAGSRVDLTAATGTDYYLRVEGSGGTARIRLTNQVSVSGNAVTVSGTDSADSFSFTAGSQQHTVLANGVSYAFDATTYTSFTLDGGGGADLVKLTGTSGDEQFTLNAGSAQLDGASFTATATSAEEVHAISGGGADTANLYGTTGADNFFAYSTHAYLQGSGYLSFTSGMATVNAYAGGGDGDVANLYDSAGDDTFTAHSTYAVLSGAGFSNYAGGFDLVHGFASAGGDDTAHLYDSAGNDRFTGYSTYATMQGDGFMNYVGGFETVNGYSQNGGADEAWLFDSTGDDQAVARTDYAYLQGTGFHNRAEGFGSVYLIATLGNDHADLYDSTGTDNFFGAQTYAMMLGTGYLNYAGGFNSVTAHADNGGVNFATLFDSIGNDTLVGTADYTQLSGDGFSNRAEGFDYTYGFSSLGGDDTARFYDSAGDDYFRGHLTFAYLYGTGFFNYGAGFDNVYAYSQNGGSDEANFYDSAGDDQFVAQADSSSMTGAGYYNYAEGFDRVHAFALYGGNDSAEIYDTAGNDTLISSRSASYLLVTGGIRYAAGFDSVTVRATAGGHDDVGFIDPQSGDVVYGRAGYLDYTSGTTTRRVEGFDVISAQTLSGDTDEDVSATDYYYASLSN
ncbi:MAG: S8 family serine peptidase [Planctomycetota bacterium]